MKIFYTLLIFLALLTPAGTASAQTNQVPDDVELAALKSLYDNLGGNAWTDKTNWPAPGSWPATATAAQMGTWKGVTVSSGDIVKIELPANNLTGTLPASLQQLTRLRTLTLRNNNLQGNIPKEIGTLTKLTYLDLSTNALTGSIPDELGNLVLLTDLYLHTNQLTGAIPPGFGKLKELTKFYVYANQLSGELPAGIGDWSKLTYFLAYNNAFTGGIPASFSKLTNVRTLALETNKLTGELPSMSNWTKLAELTLQDNDLSGAFPESVKSCSLLVTLRLHGNNFTSIPDALITLPALNVVRVHDNVLTMLPDFSKSPKRSTLILSVSDNLLDFSQIEPLVGAGIGTFVYSPQKTFPVESPVALVVDEALRLPGRPFGANSTIFWEKKQGTSWVNVDASNEDKTKRSYYRIIAKPADAGIYRWRMTNTKVKSTTLLSGEIVVKEADVMIVDQLAYQYVYDNRNRLIKKKLPGADWVHMVYDPRDRLVLTQDGNQRVKSIPEWTYTKYDALNRPVATGVFKHATILTQEAMQDAVNSFYAPNPLPSARAWFERLTNGAFHGYENKSFPASVPASDCHTVIYYDNYTFRQGMPTPATAFDYDAGQLPAAGTDAAQEPAFFAQVKGLVTGRKVKNFESGTWLWTVNYYDDKYRVIQSVTENHKGGIDRTSSTYDFVSKVLRTKTSHAIAGGTSISTLRKFVYDHAGRLQRVWHQTGNSPAVILLENDYNALGQLVTKKLHSEGGAPFLQNIDYRYNIRGWLTQINRADLAADGGPKDYFGLELGYENDLGLGSYAPQYTGNVSAAKWSANMGLGMPSLQEPTERAYTYGYDVLGRMTDADHKIRVGTWRVSDAHAERVKYDLQGNILSLYRSDIRGRAMDRLTYRYGEGVARGNQLKAVLDGADGKGFRDGRSVAKEYDYDRNGNVIRDANKGIISFKYNSFLNLTEEIEKEGGEKVRYRYTADGLRVGEDLYAGSGATPRRMDYIGPFVYQDNVLQFIQHAEGKVVMPTGATGAPEYQYQLKDHLDNTRLTFTTRPKTDTLMATMEDNGLASESNPRVQEMKHFDRLFETEIRNVSQWLNHTSNASGNAIYLNGLGDRTIGPGAMLKVYPGDVVTMDAFGKYEDASSSYNGVPAAAMLAALMTPLEAAITAIDGLAGVSPVVLGEQLAPLFGTRGNNGDAPRAYINYILFDRDWVPVDMGYDPIAESAGFEPLKENTVSFDQMTLERTIDRVGYLYVYVSNESEGARVWMDDLTIRHRHSPIIQMEDYYPFGLSMEGTAFERGNIDYKGMVTPEGTGLKDLGFRQYDPVLGRFHAVDPLAEIELELSTYQYAGNNPATSIDLLGLEEEIKSAEANEPKTPAQKEKRKKIEKPKKPKRTHWQRGYSLFRGGRRGHGENRANGRRANERREAEKKKKEESKKKENKDQAKKTPRDEASTPTMERDVRTGVAASQETTAFLLSSVRPEREVEGLRDGYISRAVFAAPMRSLVETDAWRSKVAASIAESFMVRPSPLMSAYNMARRNPPGLEQYLGSRLPGNEARALIFSSIYRQDVQGLSSVRQNSAVMGNTTTGDDQVMTPQTHPIEVVFNGSGIVFTYGGVTSRLTSVWVMNVQPEEVPLLDITDVIQKDLSTDGNSTLETEWLAKLAADYAMKLISDAEAAGQRFTEQSVRQFILDHQADIQQFIDQRVAQLQNSPDIKDFTLNGLETPERTAMQQSIDKFKNTQNLKGSVQVLDDQQYAALLQLVQEGKLKPKAGDDVMLLMMKGEDGTMQKTFVYRDNLFVLKDEAEADNGSKIQITNAPGAMKEVEASRDKAIDNAIRDNTLEGIQVDQKFEHLNIWEKGMWVIKTTKTLLDDVKIKDDYWHNKKNTNTLPFYIPDPLAGGGNAVLEEVKQIPEMVAMGLSMFDPEVRRSLLEAMAGMTWAQVGEMLKDMLNDMTSNYTSNDDEKITYQGTKDASSVIISMAEGPGGLVKKVKELVPTTKTLSRLNWKTLGLPKEKAKKLGGHITENPALEQALIDNPQFSDIWKRMDDAGLDVLGKNPIELKKFDDLVKSNNLGLDADGLSDLLKAPKGKGLDWDAPDKVLDAVKRASDANVSGLSISHKKFPAPANGTDNYVLKNAKQYQAEASGDAALSFNKGGVSFDDVAADGKLVDRKFGHGSSVFDEDFGVINQVRANSIVDQAKRQLAAVGGDGTKLRWEISTERGASGIEQLFLENSALVPGIDKIEVVYVVQKTIVP